MDRLRSTARRTLHATAAGAALLALVAAACGEPSGTDGPGPLVVAYQGDLQTLNPVVSTDQNANDVMYSLLFTPLVRFDSAYEVAPALAESWELGDSTVTFELRDDLRWHDGEPVTAEDVAFTFELAKSPGAASPMAAAFLESVASVEVIGPHRVRFRFTEPHAEPLQDFYWPPVPEHVLEGVEPSELARHPFGRAPVGNGPYHLDGWKPGEALEFVRVDSFPEELGGVPAIERVVYRIVPERTTRLRELLNGTIHVDGPVVPSDADRLRASDRVELEAFPWRMFTYVGWNTRDPRFRDPRVRRALTMALDRRELLRAALYGYGEVAASPIPPWHPLAPEIAPLPYAPDSARALLEAAGWSDTDGDGVRDRDGRSLAFDLLTGQANPVHADLVQMIQAQLARLGVAVEPRLLEWQTVLQRHRARDFDAVLTNWVLDSFRIDPRALFHSSQVDVAGSANRSSYSDPVADSLMELGVRLTDRERAREVWTEFARVLQNDQPFTFLFWNEELAGVSRRLEGVHMDARGELRGLPGWSWADAAETGE